MQDQMERAVLTKVLVQVHRIVDEKMLVQVKPLGARVDSGVEAITARLEGMELKLREMV